MRVLIVAGGTGGHLYPGISVAQQLVAEHHEVMMLVRNRPQETGIISRYKLPFRTVSGVGFKKGVVGFFSFFFSFVAGFSQSWRILQKFRPDMTFALGNYLSLPVGLASYCKKIPLVLHEQNYVPGKATKFLSRFSTHICLSFAESVRFFLPCRKKIAVTGNPLRAEMRRPFSSPKDAAYFTLLVFGGSQGAHSINKAMVDALDYLEGLRKTMRIIHITGEHDTGYVEAGYRERNFQVTIASYINDMHEVYAQTDLVVCRAGALTLSEIGYFGIPAILIPYPHAAENHQFLNAQAYARSGGAVVIEDKGLTGKILADTIIRLSADRKELKTMREKAKGLAIAGSSEKIVEILESTIQKSGARSQNNKTSKNI